MRPPWSMTRARVPLVPTSIPRTYIELLGRELEDSDGVIFVSRLQFGGGEIRMVGRVGIMLGLQAKCIAVVVNVTALSMHRAVQEVAGIELDARFSGQHLHDASALGIVDLRRQPRRLGDSAIEHKLWSYPRPNFSCSSLPLMRAPMAVDLVKS